MKTLIIVVLMLVAAQIALAQWEPDVRLTNHTGNSLTSLNNAWCIAGSGDILHVAWYDNRDGNKEIYYKRSTDAGTTWGADQRLTNRGGYSQDVSIAVSGSVVHIVWSDERDANGEIYYKRSTNGGDSWEPDMRLTNAAWNSFLPSIAVSGSQLHVVWQDERDAGNGEIYYKSSTDGGTSWGLDIRLTNNSEYSGIPSVAVSGSVVHVFWEDYWDGNGEIYYIRSINGGVNWGAEINLTNNTVDSWDPSVAVSGSTVHITWMEDVEGGDYEIFYRRSTTGGLSWQGATRLTYNSATSIYPSIAVQGSDIHIAWEDMRDGQKEIYYQSSTDAGISWLGTETRLTSSSGTPKNASVSSAGSQVNVVWNDSRDGNIEVYYKRFLPLPDSVYYNRLFYLCKAWGHAKYYHTGIANGNINWDDELFKAIHGAKLSFANAGFNDSLQMILNNAGTMGYNPNILPVVPDSLNNNLDMSWIQNGIFSDTVKALLDTIRSRFRPQPNVYVNYTGYNPDFESDQLYYNEANYPNEEKRILALFRYWNMVNYFYPYKNIMDQDWDTTLVEFIPKIVESTDALAYSLNFKELTTRINDTHAFFYSPDYWAWNGANYPPFLARYIDNEMVITKVLPGIADISAGDIIKEIDGADIYTLRDSLRKYAHGSNDVVIEREINSMILYGPFGNSQIELDNGTTIISASFNRNTSNYINLNLNTNPVWVDTTINRACRFGIVDMGRLTPEMVDSMFTDLWESDAIIFDIRNYPHETLSSIVNYLFTGSVNNANFTIPDTYYPGRLYWHYNFIGSGTSNPYAGNIIILFDERTQSQAEYACMGLEQFPGAIKIGSTTAGADGNVSRVYVPGNILTYFTGFGVFYPDYTQTQRVGIIPDIEVHATIPGIRAGIDEVLAYALDCMLVGKKEDLQVSEVILYPNPFNDKLYYKLPGSNDNQRKHFEIFDILGRKIASSEKFSNQGEIDFSGCIGGAYFVKVTTRNEVLTRKVIKY